MENWRLEAIKKNLERITRQQKWDQQINELMKAIEALPVWVGHTKEFEEQNIRLNQKRDVEACEYLNSHPQVVTDGCNDRSCVKENVALTHFDEEFVQEDPKELSYAQEKVKEDVGLGSGLEAVEKKLEKDGTYSSREQGEADWQLASETDLQDFHYTIFEHKWAGIQGLGSNYKRSGLEFYSIMIFGLQLEQHVLYGPLFEQRMIWDPGIRIIFKKGEFSWKGFHGLPQSINTEKREIQMAISKNIRKNKGQEDVKSTLNGELKSISDKLNQVTCHLNSNEISILLSTLQENIKVFVLNLHNDLYKSFTNEMQALGCKLKALDRKNPRPTVLPSRAVNYGANLVGVTAQKNSALQPKFQPGTRTPKVERTRIPKVEMGGWNLIVNKRKVFVQESKGRNCAHFKESKEKKEKIQQCYSYYKLRMVELRYTNAHINRLGTPFTNDDIFSINPVMNVLCVEQGRRNYDQLVIMIMGTTINFVPFSTLSLEEEKKRTENE
ncbi:recombination initiation defects 3 [Tanacetum coccineum]